MRLIGNMMEGGRVLVVGNGVAQAIGVLVAPLLTRLYSTEEFGYLTMFISVYSILGIVAALRYDQGVLAAEEEETAETVLGLSIFASVLVGAVLLVPLLLFSWLSGPVAKVPQDVLAFVAVLLPISIVATGVFQGLLSWSTRRMEFRILAKTRVRQSIAGAVVQVLGGLLWGGYQILMIGYVIGRAAGIGTLWGRRPPQFRQRLSRRSLSDVAKRFRRFPLYAAPAAILNNSALLIPTVLFGAVYGSTVAGWFGLGQRVIGVPMFILGSAAANVYAARFANLAKEGRGARRDLMRRTIKRLLPFSALILAGSLFGPPLFAFVFGEEWRTAGSYVAILAVPFSLQLLTSPVSITANLVGRQDLQLAFDTVRLLLVVGVLALAPRFGADAKTAVMLLSGVLSVTYLAYLALYWSLLREDATT